MSPSSSTPTSTRFLGSHNPAQVKRNVLASFTNVLLLPVTIVPRTVGAVGAALTTGGTAAVQGITMLNPQRWGGGSGGGISMGYSRDLGNDDTGGGTLLEVGDGKDAAFLGQCKFSDIYSVFFVPNILPRIPINIPHSP